MHLNASWWKFYNFLTQSIPSSCVMYTGVLKLFRIFADKYDSSWQPGERSQIEDRLYQVTYSNDRQGYFVYIAT